MGCAKAKKKPRRESANRGYRVVSDIEHGSAALLHQVAKNSAPGLLNGRIPLALAGFYKHLAISRSKNSAARSISSLLISKEGERLRTFLK